MIINQLKIKNFGKFQDKTIELKPGINVVYGENESGKSTIFAFIRAMFFGIERQRGKAARTDDYWRYEPWDHPMLYDGVMKVTRDNRIFRIERNFCKAKKEWHVIDETQGKELSEKEAEDIFLKDLTPSFYDNTISLPQKRTAASKDLIEELKYYVGNMSSALDSRIDVSKALESLEKEKRKKEKSADRQAEGKYNEIVEYRKRLEEDYKRMSKELETANEVYEKAKKELSEAKKQAEAKRIADFEWEMTNKELFEKKESMKKTEKEIERLSQEIRKYQEISRHYGISSLEDITKIHLELQQASLERKNAKDQLDSIEEKSKEEERKLTEIKEEQRKRPSEEKTQSVCCILAAAAGIALIAAGDILTQLILVFLGAALTIVAGTVFGILRRKIRRGKLRKEKEKSSLENSVKNLREKRKEYSKVLNERITVEEGILCGLIKNTEPGEDKLKKAESVLEQLSRVCRKKEEDTFILDRLTEEGKNVQNEIWRLEKKQKEAEGQISLGWKEGLKAKEEKNQMVLNRVRRAEWELEKLKEKQNQLEEDFEYYSEAKDRQKKIQTEIEALSLAKSAIENISDRIQGEFGRKFNQYISEIFSTITGGKYNNLKVDDESVPYLNEENKLITSEQLSVGTVEQIALAVRLAAVKVVFGKEKMPLLLDEAFAMYDEKRMLYLLKWLEQTGNQIILFTCQKREKEALDLLGFSNHYIEL